MVPLRQSSNRHHRLCTSDIEDLSWNRRNAASAPPIRCRRSRCGRGRAYVRRNRRPARSACGAAGAWQPAGSKNPHLRRRTLQLHQPSCTPQNFLSENRHFAKSALASTRRAIFLSLSSATASPGTRRPWANSSATARRAQILDMLLAECELAKVEFVLNARSIAVEKVVGSGFPSCLQPGNLRLRQLSSQQEGCPSPKWEPRASATNLPGNSGLRIVEPRPALVPLVLGGDEAPWTTWPVCNRGYCLRRRTRFETPANHRRGIHGARAQSQASSLFGRRCSSPIAASAARLSLQASSYWRPGEDLGLDLAPEPARIRRPRRTEAAPGPPRSSLLSARRCATSCHSDWRHYLADTNCADGWSNAALEAWSGNCLPRCFTPSAPRALTKPKSPPAASTPAACTRAPWRLRSVPGLYFIGEVVDVTGWLGGLNFQWAWASAVAAGQAI